METFFSFKGYNIQKEEISLTKLGIEKDCNYFNKKSKSPFCHHVISIELKQNEILEKEQILSLSLFSSSKMKFQFLTTFNGSERKKIFAVFSRIIKAPSIENPSNSFFLN
jgi:hypothetical protein